MRLDNREYLMEPLYGINVMDLGGEGKVSLMELQKDLSLIAVEYARAAKVLTRMISSIVREEQLELEL